MKLVQQELYSNVFNMYSICVGDDGDGREFRCRCIAEAHDGTHRLLEELAPKRWYHRWCHSDACLRCRRSVDLLLRNSEVFISCLWDREMMRNSLGFKQLWWQGLYRFLTVTIVFLLYSYRSLWSCHVLPHCFFAVGWVPGFLSAF